MSCHLNNSLSFAAAAAAGAAAADADAFGVGRVVTRSRAASAAASATASRSGSRCPSPPRASRAVDDCSSLAAALCAKLAPLQSKAAEKTKKRAAADVAKPAKAAKPAAAKTAPEVARVADETEDGGSSGGSGGSGGSNVGSSSSGSGSSGSIGKQRSAKVSRKRTPEERERANNVNMVRRALDENIKVILGDSTETARPLPAERFSEDKLSSILCCKGYKYEIGFEVPLFIEGIKKPLFTNTASSCSRYAKMMPMTSNAFDSIHADDYEARCAAAATLCAPTKSQRVRRAPRRVFTSAAPSPFAIRLGVPACINGHTLMSLTAGADKETKCSICGCECRDFKSCADIACRSSSTICDECLDYVAPNTQAAFFIAASAEHADADFVHGDAITALGKLSTSNGNTVPLDGRQIAGLKLHRESDDDAEIVGNYSAITTATRDILLKALTHTHNTPETAFDMFIKASALGDAVAKSDTTIATLRAKLQRMEAESADLKRIHATAAHMVACSKLRAVGQLPQSPVVSGKERAVMKRISFAAAAPAAAAASEDDEMADAAGGAAPTADDSSDSDSSDSSDSDSSDSDSD